MAVASAVSKAGTNNVAILINAYGLEYSVATIRPRVTEIFKRITSVHEKLASSRSGPPPFPVLHRENWFTDTNVISFKETYDGVETAVFVCISPDNEEARRMHDLIREEKEKVLSGKKQNFGLGRTF